MKTLFCTLALFCSIFSTAQAAGGLPAQTFITGYSFFDNVNCPSYGQAYCWGSIQAVAVDRLSWDTTIKRTPEGSMKVTVQAGDVVASGERAEVLEMFNANDNDENGNSGTKYYGYSVYIPSGFQSPSNWAIVLQLHGPNSYTGAAASPTFALDVRNGRFKLDQRGGNKNSPTIISTDIGALQYDTWVDFVFKVTWAADNTGATAVWTRTNRQGVLLPRKVDANNNGDLISQWNTPTLYQNGSGVIEGHYWKKGFYRSPESFTNVLYESRLSRADNFQDAATIAFNQYP